MANTLRFKRGLLAGIPTAALGEPLFTTDTFDLYIGNGTTNTRFQKYIASGATTQILRGDGSLYTFPLAISSPTNGQVLKYNGTSWVNDSDAGITGSGTTNYLPKFTGATTLGNSNLISDANGNFGFQSTPNALALANTLISVRDGSLVSSAGTYIHFLTNSYYNTDWKYNVTSLATRYSQEVGSHKWFTAPSGTANATITWSQPMTLTANGRLLLGTTNEGTQRLQVAGDVKFDADAATNGFYWDNTNKSLGIGTTSPSSYAFSDAAKLVVSNTSANSTLSIVSGTSSYGYLAFADGTSGVDRYRGLIEYNHSDNSLGFRTNGSNAMHITSGGSVGIGTTSLTGYTLRVAKALTSSNYVGIGSEGIIDNTTIAYYFNSLAATANTTFTVNNLYHFAAIQGTKGAASTITNQYGYIADATLTGATNNYGFYGNIASGTGRWNLYMNGTANNYLAGNTQIGAGAFTSQTLQVNGTMKVTGASTFSSNITTNGFIYVTPATGNAIIHITRPATSNGAGLILYTGATQDWQVGTAWSEVSSNFIIYNPQTGTQSFKISSTTNAATFSSSVTAGGNVLLTNGTASSVGAINLIRTGTSPVASRLTFGTDGTGYSFALGKNQGGTVTDLFSILDSGAATFSSSVTGASFIPTSSTIPTNGMYLGATNQLNFATNSTSRLNISGTGVATFSSTINVGGTATFTNASSVNIVGTSTLVGATARNTSSASGDTQAGFFVENGTSNGQLYKAGTGYTTRKTIVANDLGFYNAAAGNISILNDFASGNINFAAGGSSTAQWTIGTNGDLTAADGENIIVGTTNGTKIGTSGSQKLGFWNATPIAQPNNSIAAANFVAGIGTTVTTLDAFDGYTIGQVVKALRNAGILS